MAQSSYGSKLFDFLRELSENSDRMAEFEKDAYETMTKYGLSAEEKDLVFSGDEDRIMRYIGSEDVTQAARRCIRIRNIRIRVR